MRIAAAKARVDLRNIVLVPDSEDIHINLRTIAAFFYKMRNQRKEFFVLEGYRFICLSCTHYQLFLSKDSGNLSGEYIRIDISTDLLPIKELLNNHVWLMLEKELCGLQIICFRNMQTGAAKTRLHKNREGHFSISKSLFKRCKLYIGFRATITMICQPVIHSPFVEGHFTQLIGRTYNCCADSFKCFFMLGQKR